MLRKHHHDPETCEQCQKHHRNHNSGGGGGFFDGLLWGALIGGVLGVLYAPEKGSESRAKLKEAADDVAEKGQEAYKKGKAVGTEIKTAAEPLIDEIEEMVRPVLERAAESGGDVQFKVMEKIEQLVEDAAKAEKDVSKRTRKFFRGTSRKK